MKKNGKENYWIYQAKHNGEIVGQVDIGFHPNFPNEGYVYSLSVLPNLWGRGFGRMLNQFCIDFFQKKKITRMRLTVSCKNTNAMDFYLKLGWKNLGLRTDFEDPARLNNPDSRTYYFTYDL